jgi:hypothetical protein
MDGPHLIATLPNTPKAAGAAPSRELQQLWFATQHRPWSSLALVPIQPYTSAKYIGEALAEIGVLHRGVNVRLVDAENATVASSSRLVLAMSNHVATGGLVVAVLDSVVQNQAGIPLAMTADAVLLAVDLGETESAAARRTLELIGRDRIIGAVAIRGPDSR